MSVPSFQAILIGGLASLSRTHNALLKRCVDLAQEKAHEESREETAEEAEKWRKMVEEGQAQLARLDARQEEEDRAIDRDAKADLEASLLPENFPPDDPTMKIPAPEPMAAEVG